MSLAIPPWRISRWGRLEEIPTERRVESFADDLNTRLGIVSGRVALLPRSTEIHPKSLRFVPLVAALGRGFREPWAGCRTWKLADAGAKGRGSQALANERQGFVAKPRPGAGNHGQGAGKGGAKRGHVLVRPRARWWQASPRCGQPWVKVVGKPRQAGDATGQVLAQPCARWGKALCATTRKVLEGLAKVWANLGSNVVAKPRQAGDATGKCWRNGAQDGGKRWQGGGNLGQGGSKVRANLGQGGGKCGATTGKCCSNHAQQAMARVVPTRERNGSTIGTVCGAATCKDGGKAWQVLVQTTCKVVASLGRVRATLDKAVAREVPPRASVANDVRDRAKPWQGAGTLVRVPATRRAARGTA